MFFHLTSISSSSPLLVTPTTGIRILGVKGKAPEYRHCRRIF